MKYIPTHSKAWRENDRQTSLIKVDEEFLDKMFITEPNNVFTNIIIMPRLSLL